MNSITSCNTSILMNTYPPFHGERYFIWITIIISFVKTFKFYVLDSIKYGPFISTNFIINKECDFDTA